MSTIICSKAHGLNAADHRGQRKSEALRVPKILQEWDEVINSSASPLPQARSIQRAPEEIPLFSPKKSKLQMKSCVPADRDQFVLRNSM